MFCPKVIVDGHAMIEQPNPVPPAFGRLAPGGSPGGGSDRTAGSSFASVLGDLLGTKAPGGAGYDSSAPLDREALKALILKISERMDSSLLSLAGEESRLEGGVPWYGQTAPTPAA